MSGRGPDRGKFDWDDQKALANFLKHGIGFEEAQSVFGDSRTLTRYDEEHSITEDRYIAVGFSVAGRLLTVVVADDDPDMRIISARQSTRAEARQYAKVNKNRP